MRHVTVGEALHAATDRFRDVGIDDPRLEAEVLLALAMQCDRTHVIAALPDALPAAGHGRFESLVARRLTREPLAYITGVREFFGIDITCGPGALIPRPETELLVELALVEVAARAGPVRIADVGTGTAAIAIAVALGAAERHPSVVAIERSPAALALARVNIDRYAGGLVELVSGDLLEGAGAFDVVLANLPYVSEEEWRTLGPEVREWEPREALVGGRRGTEVIERLLTSAPAHLAPGGVLAVEIGSMQAQAVLHSARDAFGEATISVVRDLAGLDRAVVVRPERRA